MTLRNVYYFNKKTIINNSYLMNNFVTIAIPTYKRPNLLSRAIDSVISKDHIFEILISINGRDEYFEDYQKIQKKYSNFSNIKFFFQEHNLGFIGNLNFLINKCKTEFISLLADDDESDPDGIIKLKNFLIKNKDYVSACLFWEFKSFEGSTSLIKPKYFDQKNILIRILKYIYSSDDAFFYGLHRTSSFKKCSFEGYWRPNQNELANWAYVFQFDLLLQGKIYLLNDKKYRWVNHDYTQKHYYRPKLNFFLRSIKYIIRRINIYYLYLKKILFNKNYLIFFIILLISPGFLLRDLIFREPIYHKVKSKINKI